MREQNGFRHRIALRVILLDERGKHLGRVALGDVEERVFLILQRADAVMQHADARAGLSLHKGDNVQLCERTGNHMLLGAQLLDSTQAVTQDGGTLKLQFLGGFVHLLGEFTLELFCVALEQRDRLFDQRVILLWTDLAGAWRTAAAEVQIQARPVLADVPREGTRTAFEVQCFTDRINRSSCGAAAHVRTEVPRSVMCRLGDNFEIRVGQRGVQPHIGIAFVVLEQNVVLWLVLLYHRVLEHERFKLAVRDDDIEVVDMADQLARLGVQPFGRLEVVGHAVLQQLGLADVNHLAGLILVHVNAGLHGQLAHALLQLFSCHANCPPSLNRHLQK